MVLREPTMARPRQPNIYVMACLTFDSLLQHSDRRERALESLTKMTNCIHAEASDQIRQRSIVLAGHAFDGLRKESSRLTLHVQ
jgi:hypothetical protein